ncbi:cytochrome P450 [Clohesyomyces aquaticus]|uniref:Cytochrome P450 n=1 Tax=Clohesyomyces aquaticus TaxID=1231657 RepID=A0A1Y1ZUH4_9PLEO|nr:cytochrome P450 [Clohesyomyces aquaticus]
MYLGLGAAVVALFLIGQRWLREICHLGISWAVGFSFSPRVDLTGPQWTYPNGQLLGKFLNGVESSRAWRKYGSVYRIWSLLTPEVVLTWPEDVQSFYSDSRHHEKSPSSNAGWLFQQMLGNAMGLVNGKRWRRLRTGFEKYFTHGFIATSGPRIRETIQRCLDEIFVPGQRTLLCPNSKFRAIPFLCTAAHIYGKLTEDEIRILMELCALKRRIFGNILKGGVYCFPIAQWVRPAEVKELRLFTSDWLDFNKKAVESRKESRDAPIVRIWERARKEENGIKETLQTLDEMLFANLDVSAHALIALLLFLAHSPESQDILHLEVNAAEGNIDKYCNSKETFLQNCLWEAMRLKPVSVFSMPEKSSSQTRLCSTIIPADTWVVVDALSINCNPAFWGDDCESFNPNRFQRISKADLKWNFFTYGFGTRQCLGKYIADYIIKMFLILLIQKYEWTPHGNDTLRHEGGSAWASMSGIHIVLIPRCDTKTRKDSMHQTQ